MNRFLRYHWGWRGKLGVGRGNLTAEINAGFTLTQLSCVHGHTKIGTLTKHLTNLEVIFELSM